MSEWDISSRGHLMIFDHRCLYDHCVYDTVTHHSQELVVGYNAHPYLKQFMIAMVLQALDDILFINTDGQRKCLDTLVRNRQSAERYLQSLESLDFLGMPDMRGSDFLKAVLKNQETIDRVSKTLRYYKRKDFTPSPKTVERRKIG